jgi:hypothetical protein
MPALTRQSIIGLIYKFSGVVQDDDLMDYLQDMGLVADEAIHLADVPDVDLLAALIKLQKLN